MMADLKELRQRIDQIDEQILRSLCERVKTCRAIGEKKNERGIPIRDRNRESQVYEHVRAKAAEFALDPAQVEAVYREIVNMCSVVQQREEKRE
ncbi:MAG: chorismate mutase [Candidatus Bathyarchaeia archaeon]